MSRVAPEIARTSNGSDQIVDEIQNRARRRRGLPLEAERQALAEKLRLGPPFLTGQGPQPPGQGAGNLQRDELRLLP